METPLTMPVFDRVSDYWCLPLLLLSVSLSLFRMAGFVISFTEKPFTGSFCSSEVYVCVSGGAVSLSPAVPPWSTGVALKGTAVCSAQPRHAYRQHPGWKHSPCSWLPGEASTWLFLLHTSRYLDSQLPSLPFWQEVRWGWEGVEEKPLPAFAYEGNDSACPL